MKSEPTKNAAFERRGLSKGLSKQLGRAACALLLLTLLACASYTGPSYAFSPEPPSTLQESGDAGDAGIAGIAGVIEIERAGKRVQGGNCLPRECLKGAVEAREQGLRGTAIERLIKLRSAWPGTLQAARAGLLLALIKIDADGSKLKEKLGEKKNAARNTPDAPDPIDALDIDAVGLLAEARVLADIDEYLNLYTARALKIDGNAQDALKIISRRVKNEPIDTEGTHATVLAPVLLNEEASLYAALGEHKEEQAVLLRLAELYPKHALVPGALLRAAKLSYTLNEPALAGELALSLRTEHAGSAEAEEAATVLEWLSFIDTPLIATPGIKSPSFPTFNDRYTRARGLYKAAMYGAAHKELDYLIKNVRTAGAEELGHNSRPDKNDAIKNEKDKKSELFTNAVLLKAITLFREKRYTETVRLLTARLNELATEMRPDALYWIAVTGGRLERADHLSFALVELDRTPERRERAWALLLNGRLYEKLGNHKLALRFFTTVTKEYSSRPAMHATWHIAWKSYLKGDYEEARRVLDRFLEKAGNTTDSGDNGFRQEDRDKFTYWSARSSERIEDKEKRAGRGDETSGVKSTESSAKYRELCRAGHASYYCQMASERLAGLDLPTPHSALSPETDRRNRTLRSLEAYQGYRTARELLLLGLGNEAAEELNRLATRLIKNPKGKWRHNPQQDPQRKAELVEELATLFHASGDYYRGLKLYSRHLGGKTLGDKTDGNKTTAEATHIAYPMEVVEWIEAVVEKGNRAGGRYNRGPKADPLLVAAIMREESTFNPKAVSHSGALGLMQIMPATGDFIAMKLRTRAPDRAGLLDPETNIRYGAWYLGYLAKRFNSNPILTIAGYNAGPRAAARWAKSATPGPLNSDEFIESIPYAETRRYTKRVLRSYTAYLLAAGIDPATRFSRPLIATAKSEPKKEHATKEQASNETLNKSRRTGDRERAKKQGKGLGEKG
jgi:tetratricopeptide (TPR) repeat protein